MSDEKRYEDMSDDEQAEVDNVQGDYHPTHIPDMIGSEDGSFGSIPIQDRPPLLEETRKGEPLDPQAERFAEEEEKRR